MDSLIFKEDEFKRRKENVLLNHNNSQLENRIKFFQHKKVEEENKIKIREEKCFPFLDLKSEERLLQHKNHVIKLEDKIDKNYENTKNYLNNNIYNHKQNSLSENNLDHYIFGKKMFFLNLKKDFMKMNQTKVLLI